ncbi:probable ATP-dependent RNA helicase Dbp73D [Cydia strobilella]|uniref:probable ATP-dependent RNA helicase Dbp73D n=1 Tax=Cydia strobilella TaxID=1100964 RepID=UPI003003AE78
MDLFTINRYRDPGEDIDLFTHETKQLQKLKQKIEERRKTHSTFKQLDVITLKQETAACTKSDHSFNPKPAISIQAEEDKDETVDNIIDNTIQPQKIVEQKPNFEFKVLGTDSFEKKTKVKRVLPYWLSHPYSLSTNLQKLTCVVDEQDWLNDTLKTTLKSEGVAHFFPVQEQVIPFIIKENRLPHPFWAHDVCVSAPTGSGKTLAFVLPIIQVLMNSVGHHVRAMIVLPVQELATQVSKVFKKYCTNTGLKVVLLTASTPLRKEQQQIVKYTESAGWISEADIIVCTAGRLVEHIQNTEGFSLKHLKFLVIDEADKIMDHIQNDWLYHVDKHIKLENELMTGKVPNLNWNSLNEQNPPPHKLLFSATLSQDPEKLERWGLFQPKLFSAAPITDFEDEDSIRKYTTPDELTEQYVTCSAEEKPLILYHFLVEQKWDKVICFTNAAQSVHRLSVLLDVWGKGSLKVAELSAALDRSNRDLVLKKFTHSEINVLVSTDALARGIDIPSCDYVVSYDPPRNIKTYIHRVGRTGRAGRIGHAVTILQHNQMNLFKELLQSGGKSELKQIQIEPDVFDRLSSDYQYAIEETKNVINTEITTNVKKSVAIKKGCKKRKHE